jgi:predicted ferric reductase
VSRPFGIDLVMQYHRQMGMLAIGAIAAHGAVLVARRPGYLAALDPSRGGFGPLAGVLSFAALLALVSLSVWRRQLGIGYERWRILHGLLSVGALAGAQIHVSLSGLYASTPWKHAALSAFSLACVAVVAYLRFVMPARLRRRPWAVSEVRSEGGSTWTVALEPVGHPGLRFAPGQFAWIRIGKSPWSVDEHPFSFSSSAARPGRIEFGIKELGDFTRTIGSVAPGTPAYVDGPHGSFSIDFVENGAGVLFVAGGIGIAPILSMLRTLADRGDRRPHVLVYACTSLDRFSFRDAIEALRARLDLEFVPVLSEPPAGWSGATGFVNEDLLRGRVAANGRMRDAFVCGPDAMMSAVETALLACGAPARKIHMERFQLV